MTHVALAPTAAGRRSQAEPATYARPYALPRCLPRASMHGCMAGCLAGWAGGRPACLVSREAGAHARAFLRPAWLFYAAGKWFLPRVPAPSLNGVEMRGARGCRRTVRASTFTGNQRQ
jgi:hypothetical protein